MELKKKIILENGEELSELEFAWDALSYSDLLTARKIKSLVVKDSMNAALSLKLDSELHIGIAWVAAMKHNKNIQLNDILKLGLSDAIELSDLALDDYLI